jgi:cysteine synthase A
MSSEQKRQHAIECCQERGIIIPTFAELRHPTTIDPLLRQRLQDVDPDAVDPLNLFRINWYNDRASGGFGEVNTFELPSALTGVEARIVAMVGKSFPTRTHKVGAAFGCLVPRLVSGEFDPKTQRAVWPSTGNYCRGGAFDSAVLGCRSVAILPQGMSPERFTWLEEIGAEIIATPGSESNVKEIFDACWDIRKNHPQDVIFNQFEEIGNYLWHYAVTGPAIESAFQQLAGEVAPAEVFSAAGVTSAARSPGMITPTAPWTSALRMIAPRLRGSST